jgi:hypothetical protein
VLADARPPRTPCMCSSCAGAGRCSPPRTPCIGSLCAGADRTCAASCARRLPLRRPLRASNACSRRRWPPPALNARLARLPLPLFRRYLMRMPGEFVMPTEIVCENDTSARRTARKISDWRMPPPVQRNIPRFFAVSAMDLAAARCGRGHHPPYNRRSPAWSWSLAFARCSAPRDVMSMHKMY